MWYNRIVEDLSELPSALDHFKSEVESARPEASIKGSLERSAQELPGLMAYRFGQLQELEAILKYLNIKYDKLRSDHYRKYLESYNRQLTDRSIEKYIDGESDVVDMGCVINEVALARNMYLALIKGLDIKQFQISNVVKLRTAGMEDVVL